MCANTHAHTHMHAHASTTGLFACFKNWRHTTGGHFQRGTFNILACFSDTHKILPRRCARVRACMWVMVRREGCWEEGRDVTSPLRCSHTASSAHIRSPPFISFSILPAFYSAAVCVCVCVRVMTQLWSCDCGVAGVGWEEEEGGGHEGGSEWPGAEHSRMRAARRHPTWRPKPEGEVCVNIQNPVNLQSNHLLTGTSTSDETKRVLFFRDGRQIGLMRGEGELSGSPNGHKATFF